MSNPICPNCGKDASNSPPMVPRGCERWCLKCIQERPDQQGDKCSKCKGDLHLKKNNDEISWCYHLPDKKVCENCWQQEEKNYRNHNWWGYGLIFMEKPNNGSTSGNRIVYNWNTQKWEEKDSVEGNNNPPSEVIEGEKKKIRQYLKENGIQKVKHSDGLQVEYTNKKTKTIHMGSNEDRFEFCWIRSYFTYLEEEKEMKREELFFGQETDSLNGKDNNQERERERERANPAITNSDYWIGGYN